MLKLLTIQQEKESKSSKRAWLNSRHRTPQKEIDLTAERDCCHEAHSRVRLIGCILNMRGIKVKRGDAIREEIERIISRLRGTE